MQKFNTNGAFITKWGTAGPGNSAFQQIQAITADAVTLAGWDYVTTIPARGDAEYGGGVPTLADANAATRT